jgi:hypothetical protein
MSLITVTELPQDNRGSRLDAGLHYCQSLEEGHLLFFPRTPFELPENARAFLLAQQQSDVDEHKNIAYWPNEDKVTGFVTHTDKDAEKLRRVMQTYSQRVTQFAANWLPIYAPSWRLDYASFRPQEEKGRNLRLLARNDLLHVDAFPTRPTRGDRILRVFTNLNPTEPRRWVTSDTADVLIKRFAGSPGLPLPKPTRKSAWRQTCRFVAKIAHAAGLPVMLRSPYDEFMLRLHNYLKENGDFQTTCPKQALAFPPGSTWAVFTDFVSHAALSGQYALEQTFIVAHESLVLPEKAPMSVLEKLVGGPVV